MSEKRYKIESYFTKDKRWNNLAFFVDNENAENENCFLNLNDVVDLLNSLYEENEQLKKELDEFKEVIIDKVQYGEDNLENFLIQKGIIKEDWARFDDYD